MLKIPDPAAISEQLQAIEARINQRGWDKAPELFLLFDAGNGPDAAHAVPPSQWPSGQHGDAHGDALETVVYTLQQPSHELLVWLLRRRAPGCYGAAFVSETWVRREVDTEEVDAYRAHLQAGGRRDLGDQLDAKEARTVGAYDMTGNVYLGNRIRGDKVMAVEVTTAETRLPGAHGLIATGRIPTLLAELTALVVGEPIDKHAAIVSEPEWLRGKK